LSRFRWVNTIVASRDAFTVIAKVAGQTTIAVLSNNFGRQGNQRVFANLIDQNCRSSALSGLR